MASPNRPGVEVNIELPASSTVVASPQLVPFIVGVCNQIVEVQDADGALQSDAKFTGEQYNQATVFIPQASYPDPRSNIDEINIDEGSVAVGLYFGGSLRMLDRGSNGTSGSAFLKLMNKSRKAAFRVPVDGTYDFTDSTGASLVFTLVFDVANALDTSSEVDISLYGALTAQDVCDAINTAVGSTVATLTDDDAYLQVASPTYGADSSITMRKGGSAIAKLFGALSNNVEYRVEGAGFCGQDDEDNDLVTPWIEFYQGGYFEDGTEKKPFDTAADEFWAGQVDIDGTFITSKAALVTFSGTSATISLQAASSSLPGDQFYGDGALAGDGEVIKVEQSRFKVGKLNNSLSTFDDDGQPTNRVYDTVEVSTLSASVPFAPKYAYFVAQGLTFGSILPEGVAATVTGSIAGLDERPAMVHSTADIAFPASLASLTLNFQVTEDGVEGEEVAYRFVGGPSANIAALVATLSAADEFSQITVGSSGDRLLLQTTKTGADQAISIKSTGTANPALHFSNTSATSDTGKDVEFAVQATLTGETFALPMADLTSLVFGLTVEDSKGTHALESAALSFAAATTLLDVLQIIAEGFGDVADSAAPTIFDNGIPVATLSSSGDGADTGTITITTVEGGLAVVLELTAVDDGDGWRFFGFHDATGGVPAQLDSDGGVVDFSGLDAQTIELTYTYNAVDTVITGVATGDMVAAVDAEALAILLNSSDAHNGITASVGTRLVEWFSADNDVISVRTIKGGTLAELTIAMNQPGCLTMDFAVGAGAMNDAGEAALSNADADGADSLKSTTLVFNLDDNPYDYSITFDSNSLAEAVSEINLLVNGSDDVASQEDGKLTLTSLLAGAASRVFINEDSSTADSVLGLTGSGDGSGRPNPDLYLDGEGAICIGPNILRNQSSGIPFSLASALADIYVAYTALRKDVTSSAASPSALEFEDVATMEAAIGPIRTSNPLALGVFLALLNAQTVTVSALGIDENSAAAPLGTLDGWSRALDFLESKELYALAPLTDDEYVQGLLATHVETMSLPAERSERILFIWQPIPTRGVNITVASGESGSTNGSSNSFTLDKNPNSDLIAQGIDPSDPITVAENVYLEVVISDSGASELRRYSVADVNGVVLSLTTTFTSSENTDGFFTTTTLSEELSNVDWSLKIRGAELFVTGTTIADLNAEASAVAAQATTYASRRVYFLACDALDTSLDGVTQKVEGFYAAAAIAGMVAQQAPQQPFTNLPIVGFGRVYGTDDTFSERQLDVMADGGRYLLVNLGGKAVSRHQRSTSLTSIELRELSITKALDWLAKGLRNTNRVFIGRSVISSGFLDRLTICNTGFLRYAVNLGVVRSASLTQLLQDTDSPDTVLIGVECQPVYPCNKIKITIVS